MSLHLSSTALEPVSPFAPALPPRSHVCLRRASPETGAVSAPIQPEPLVVLNSKLTLQGGLEKPAFFVCQAVCPLHLCFLTYFFPFFVFSLSLFHMRINHQPHKKYLFFCHQCQREQTAWPCPKIKIIACILPYIKIQSLLTWYTRWMFSKLFGFISHINPVKSQQKVFGKGRRQNLEGDWVDHLTHSGRPV